MVWKVQKSHTLTCYGTEIRQYILNEMEIKIKHNKRGMEHTTMTNETQRHEDNNTEVKILSPLQIAKRPPTTCWTC